MCKLTTTATDVFNLGTFGVVHEVALTHFEIKIIFWQKWMVTQNLLLCIKQIDSTYNMSNKGVVVGRIKSLACE